MGFHKKVLGLENFNLMAHHSVVEVSCTRKCHSEFVIENFNSKMFKRFSGQLLERRVSQPRLFQGGQTRVPGFGSHLGPG